MHHPNVSPERGGYVLVSFDSDATACLRDSPFPSRLPSSSPSRSTVHEDVDLTYCRSCSTPHFTRESRLQCTLAPMCTEWLSREYQWLSREWYWHPRSHFLIHRIDSYNCLAATAGRIARTSTCRTSVWTCSPSGVPRIQYVKCSLRCAGASRATHKEQQGHRARARVCEDGGRRVRGSAAGGSMRGRTPRECVSSCVQQLCPLTLAYDH